jgi:hypothetical protein
VTITESYKATLTHLHDNTEWGVSGGAISGPTLVHFLETYPEVQTILDYGCGEGSLKEFVEDKGIKKDWTLYDPGMKGLDKKPTGQFDLVITTDVLEHVEPYMIKPVLAELKSLTKDFLFNDIACYLTNTKFIKGPYIGQDLHISLHAPDTWKMWLSELDMDVIASQPYINGTARVRYLSVLRRAK